MPQVFAKTHLGTNTAWPGASDNPMRPIMYTHPVTGEEMQANYNDRNLQTDRDYQDAGFEYFSGCGWCWPILINENDLPRAMSSQNIVRSTFVSTI